MRFDVSVNHLRSIFTATFVLFWPSKFVDSILICKWCKYWLCYRFGVIPTMLDSLESVARCYNVFNMQLFVVLCIYSFVFCFCLCCCGFDCRHLADIHSLRYLFFVLLSGIIFVFSFKFVQFIFAVLFSYLFHFLFIFVHFLCAFLITSSWGVADQKKSIHGFLRS